MQLHELGTNDVIHREAYARVPFEAERSLTAQGHSTGLLPDAFRQISEAQQPNGAGTATIMPTAIDRDELAK